MKNLASEQLPNDGGWHWDRLVKEANQRLRQIGKHGKRAKIKVAPKPGKPISVQFSLPGKKQVSYGLNLPLTKNNLVKAEEICHLITTQLVAGRFTEDWFYSLIGKPEKIEEKEKPLTCGEMLEQYKAHYFRQRKNCKNPKRSWKVCYSRVEKTLLKYHDKPINLKIVREAIETTENDTPTRRYLLNGLAALLKYFNNSEFKSIIKGYKTDNNPKLKNKYIPDDTEIVHVYYTGFEIKSRCPKKWHYRYSQWQFLYALLAIYGLRVHEAWNIKNWDNPVILKNGDWIIIPDNEYNDTNNEDEQERYCYEQWKKEKLTIPAILDPKNKDYLLCIGHETKTGYRIGFPISPSGHSRNCEWIKKFNILQPLNLPDIPDPLKPGGKNNDNALLCSIATVVWFSQKKYGFTPHALRHAYNIRGHKLGINQKTLANSLGHSLQMNLDDYLKHEGDLSKVQGIKQAIREDTFKRSELEKLREENKHLKTENTSLKNENEKLRAELAMYKTIESKYK